MRKLSPPYVFIIGSMVLIIATTMYYLLIPRFEYFSGGYTIYKPGSALPEQLPQEYAVSNRYLIFKFGQYLTTYLAAFVVAYMICSKLERVKITRRYVWLHLILTTLAFILLIFVNPYIILPQNVSGYLSDVYIGGVVNEDTILQGNELILWYSSLRTPTSLIGIILCVIGVAVFFAGSFRGWNRAAND